MSGARPGATPASPSKRGRATKSAGVSSAVVSGVTMMHWRLPEDADALSAIGKFLCQGAWGNAPEDKSGVLPQAPNLDPILITSFATSSTVLRLVQWRRRT